MRAILIDPAAQTVSEIETDGRLSSLQKLVDGYIEGIYPDRFNPKLAGIHGYVNEEGRLRGDMAGQRWRIEGWPEGRLCGPCVLLGSTPSGDETDCPLDADTVRVYIGFLV